MSVEIYKNPVKIKFTDMAPEFNVKENFILNILKERYSVELSDEPDFLFYSCFSTNNFEYKNCVKIFIGGEPVFPNFNDCDYAIGYPKLTVPGRYLRVANMLGTSVGIQTSPDIQNRIVTDEMFDRRFCNFIYSNDCWGSGAKLRKEFCQKLMKYKKIDCPGRVLHNMDTDELEQRRANNSINSLVQDYNWQESKKNFLTKYKFTIAFENLQIPGFYTEKLVNPFESYSIPIYWGDPEIVSEFNPKAFINVNAYDGDFEAVIERIIELDTDKNLYLSMLKEKPFRLDYDFTDVVRFRNFLFSIIDKGNTQVRNKDIMEINFWNNVSAQKFVNKISSLELSVSYKIYFKIKNLFRYKIFLPLKIFILGFYFLLRKVKHVIKR